MHMKIILIGNLGGEPESRYTPSGDLVTSFSLAVNKSWTKDGVKQDKTTWFRVSCWRKLGETVAQYLHKGSKVYVEGNELSARPYQNKTSGEWVASLDVTADTVRFLDSKADGQTPGQVAANAVPSLNEVREEDIPF